MVQQLGLVEDRTDLDDNNWINLLSLTYLSASPYQWLDPSGVGQQARFYRAFFTQRATPGACHPRPHRRPMNRRLLLAPIG
jgi:hypothetical protein